MWVNQIILAVIGLSGGLVVAGGLFSFIIELGVVADFADRTHTGKHVMLYETALWSGGILEIFLGIRARDAWRQMDRSGVWTFFRNFCLVAGQWHLRKS